MRIYHGIDDFTKLKYAVVTSGTFDGVHVGHQEILNRLKEIGEKNHGETVVVTFWPHPRLVLHPEDNSLKVLNTFEEKAALLKEQGINHLLRIPFTKSFSKLSSWDFIENILVKIIGTKKLVIGYDHRFGKNREGSFEQLKLKATHYGFDVEEISRQDIDSIGVSSSKIRKALLEGDIETASHFLGKPYPLSGQVVKGEKLGRVLGFPTANINVDSHYKLIPGEGIYAVSVSHNNKSYGGMLYIGSRPTLGGRGISIEVNIFNFEGDIYGETIFIALIAPIRKDVQFNDLEALKKQLVIDKKFALEVLQNRNVI